MNDVPCYHAVMDHLDASRETEEEYEDHDDSYRDDADHITLSDLINGEVDE